MATVTSTFYSLEAQLICQNLIKTCSAFGSFMHLICESQTNCETTETRPKRG